MNKRLLALLLVIMMIAVVTLTGCGSDANGDASGDANGATDAAPTGDVQEIGEGDTTFRFEVVDQDENLSVWNVSTDEETLGAALVGVGLIAGDESEWGLMVTEVNGITADFAANSAFWALWVDGEFAMAGVDDTYVESGATYAFIYTVG